MYDRMENSHSVTAKKVFMGIWLNKNLGILDHYLPVLFIVTSLLAQGLHHDWPIYNSVMT